MSFVAFFQLAPLLIGTELDRRVLATKPEHFAVALGPGIETGDLFCAHLDAVFLAGLAPHFEGLAPGASRPIGAVADHGGRSIAELVPRKPAIDLPALSIEPTLLLQILGHIALTTSGIIAENVRRHVARHAEPGSIKRGILEPKALVGWRQRLNGIDEPIARIHIVIEVGSVRLTRVLARIEWRQLGIL